MGRQMTIYVKDEDSDVIEIAKARGTNFSEVFIDAVIKKVGLSDNLEIKKERIRMEVESSEKRREHWMKQLKKIEEAENGEETKKAEETTTKEQEDQKKTDEKERIEELIHQRRMELVERSADLLQPIYDDPAKFEDYDWVIENVVDKANEGRPHTERISYNDIKDYIKDGKG